MVTYSHPTWVGTKCRRQPRAEGDRIYITAEANERSREGGGVDLTPQKGERGWTTYEHNVRAQYEVFQRTVLSQAQSAQLYICNDKAETSILRTKLTWIYRIW